MRKYKQVPTKPTMLPKPGRRRINPNAKNKVGRGQTLPPQKAKRLH